MLEIHFLSYCQKKILKMTDESRKILHGKKNRKQISNLKN